MSETTATFRTKIKTFKDLEWGWNYIGESEFISPIDRGSVTQSSFTLGEKNPRWKIRIAQKRQAGTVFSGTRIVSLDRPGYASFLGTSQKPAVKTYQQWQRDWIRPSYPLPDVAAYSEVKADNEALRQFGRKVRRAQTTVQGGVVVGEFLRTVKLIVNPAKALRKGISNHLRQLSKTGRRAQKLRKGLSPAKRRLALRKAREAVADTWLEAVYGWKPLLMDIDEATEALANYHTLHDWIDVVPVRATGFDERQTYDVTTTTGPQYPFPYTRTTKTEKVSVRYMAEVDAGSQAVYSARRMGVDPSNWLPAAWELLPWSFMIDYFTNVGDMVNNASLMRSSIRWILKTTRREFVWESRGTAATPKLPISNSFYKYSLSDYVPAHVLHIKRNVQRLPYTGSLVPNLEFTLPGLSTKWLNLAALWVGRRNIESYYK